MTKRGVLVLTVVIVVTDVLFFLLWPWPIALAWAWLGPPAAMWVAVVQQQPSIWARALVFFVVWPVMLASVLLDEIHAR